MLLNFAKPLLWKTSSANSDAGICESQWKPIYPTRKNGAELALYDIVSIPQLCKEAGWQSHAFGKLYHLGGGKNLEAKQAWMDAGKSWHTAQSFEATQLGRKMAEGRNVTGGALNWCQWGSADGTDDDQPDGQIAAATVAKINELSDAPWFIGCGFMKPHDPFIAPKKYFDLYPPESLKPWRDPADNTPARKDAVGFGAYGEAFIHIQVRPSGRTSSTIRNTRTMWKS